MPSSSDTEKFLAAALAGDAAAASSIPDEVIAEVRAAHPALIVRAVASGRVEAVELLVQKGFDINALGRADVDSDEPWQTALHTAVECQDGRMVMRLLELGADTTVRDARYGVTAAQWAAHLGNDEATALLALSYR